MSRGITRGRLAAAFAVLVVAALGVLPFLVFADPYGEVPIPGAATVHLPAGPGLNVHAAGNCSAYPE
jgi:hypothetical protein